MITDVADEHETRGGRKTLAESSLSAWLTLPRPEIPEPDDLRQLIQNPSAVAELGGLCAEALEHGQPEIVQRRFTSVADVAAGANRAAAAASQQNRQVAVRVGVAIGDRTAVSDHAVIEQRPLALLYCLELADQIGVLLDVVGVDGFDLILEFFFALVMRDRVMPFFDANHRVFLVASFAAEHESDDSRDVSL